LTVPALAYYLRGDECPRCMTAMTPRPPRERFARERFSRAQDPASRPPLALPAEPAPGSPAAPA
jgi:hypothetical protein